MINKKQVIELSNELKLIAKDLTFLGYPRYPIKDLQLIFPQHRNFLSTLVDQSSPFSVKPDDKKRLIDAFFQKLPFAEIPNQLKKIFSQRLLDYGTLLNMMENFGKQSFYEGCLKLYGSSDKFSSSPNFLTFLKEIKKDLDSDKSSRDISADEGLIYLKNKLIEVFEPDDFEVKPSSSLLSDSSAGRRTLKLNPHKVYSSGELNVFLVHEGWVHLGTSLNGAYQEDNPWLGVWAPRTTSLQEGLAICTEMITHNMSLERWNKVVMRHQATTMAEKGSSILDIYHFLLHHHIEDLDALKLSLRIFRGVPLDGGMAFTKELLYLHGLIDLLFHLHFYQSDLRSLWIGKISFEEHITLLDQWDTLSPKLKYFPSKLEQPKVENRLEILKHLALKNFHQKLD